MAKRKKIYSREEYREFKRLVEACESRVQMHRIFGRLDQAKFVERVGQEKCHAMFAELCAKTKGAPNG